MNILKHTCLLAVAGVALFSQAAKADTLQYNPGQLLMGFSLVTGYGTGQTTKEYVLDLGSYQQFVTSGGFTTINLNSDLSAFDPGWASATNITWGLIGYSGTSTSTLVFASMDGASTDALYSNFPSKGQATGVVNYVTDFVTQGGFDGAAGSSVNGEMQVPSGTYSWANSVDGSVVTNLSFGKFATSDFLANDGSYSPTTLDNVSLDLVEMKVGAGTGTELGSFSLASNGDLSYQAEAVPEPSTYAMIITGGLGCLCMFRRRSFKA